MAAALTSPAGYPSPNYVPTVPAPASPVHRTRWSLIVGIVAAAVLVAGAGGTVIALFASHLGGSLSLTGLSGASPTPTLSASPGPTDSPVISTVPFEPGPLQSNGAVSLPVPAGWTVSSQDGNTIVLNDPTGNGTLTVGSGASRPPKTAQQYRDSLDAYFAGRYPDTAPCPNSAAKEGTLNGVAGIFWILCFTMTSGGQSFPAAAALFAGADSSGTVYYLVSALTSQSNLQSFVNESEPIVQGIQWKLK